LAWDDPALAIAWPLPSGVAPLVSARDRSWPGLEEFVSPFGT
jgi:dTDP-4-dehydrorhamnose 3,5-epimerase-like enzyme